MSERRQQATTIDIYKGKDPAVAALYPVAEAARYLQLPAATVRSWVLGRQYSTHRGRKPFHPLIEIADPEENLLSFRNLLELHVLSAIRRIHKVELGAVRRAIKYLREKLESPAPLLHDLLTDGRDLFIEEYGKLVSISEDGQIAMKEVLSLYLKRIERDRAGAPVRLYPITRTQYQDAPQLISIDPRIQFGKPCIAGTRITCTIIAERYLAGDSISALAEDYGREVQEIEEAIRYQGGIAA